MDTIGLITITYNSEKVLKPFLDCVWKQTYTNLILYVIDNASTDSSLVILKQEKENTRSINVLVDNCLKEKDYSTFNFLQWYVAEQHEEEMLFQSILDKIKIIGTDGQGVYLIDREVAKIADSSQTNDQP